MVSNKTLKGRQRYKRMVGNEARSIVRLKILLMGVNCSRAMWGQTMCFLPSPMGNQEDLDQIIPIYPTLHTNHRAFKKYFFFNLGF